MRPGVLVIFEVGTTQMRTNFEWKGANSVLAVCQVLLLFNSYSNRARMGRFFRTRGLTLPTILRTAEAPRRECLIKVARN